MTLSEKVLQLVTEIKRERLGSSELARQARKKLRDTIKGTLVSWTIAELKKIVADRKNLLGSEMGELRKVTVPKITPNIRSKSIIVKGEAIRRADPKKGIKAAIYKPQITFYSVDFAEEQSKEYPLSVNLGNGDIMWTEQMKSHKHPIQCRCTCPDFNFRWGWYDAKKKILSGPNKYSYTRKTPVPPMGRPYVNPLEKPGYCKHLHVLIEVLEKRKILI